MCQLQLLLLLVYVCKTLCFFLAFWRLYSMLIMTLVLVITTTFSSSNSLALIFSCTPLKICPFNRGSSKVTRTSASLLSASSYLLFNVIFSESNTSLFIVLIRRSLTAHALARVTVVGLCVCLSVCLSALNLLLQGYRATRYYTYVFLTMNARFNMCGVR